MTDSEAFEDGADRREGRLRETGSFPETRWSRVRRAADRTQPGSFEALSRICEDYWYPLYAFVRGQGASSEDAAEEVQGFFAALLEKDYLEVADQEKGRLRTFLLDALQKYRAKEHRSRQALKRGGGRPHLSLDQEWAEGRFEAEPVDHLTPEQILDRSWARLLLDGVLDRLGERYAAQGKEDEFAQLRPVLAWNAEAEPYAELANRLGISEGNLKVRVHRLKGRYRDLLEEEVRQTLDGGDAEAVQQELRHLRSALS